MELLPFYTTQTVSISRYIRDSIVGEQIMNVSKNLIGKKFGKLTVIAKEKSTLGGDTVKRYWGRWLCKCDCGNTKIVKTVDLNKGTVKSCGCIIKNGSTTLLPGQKFGRLITISYKNSKWFCQCECGEHTEVTSNQLSSGNTKSCGCLKIEISKSKANKLIEGRRQFEPRITSARRIWQNTYYYRDKNTLPFEDFLIISQQNCFYCGIQPNTFYNFFAAASTYSSKKSEVEGLFIYNGIDRVDSNLPHTLNNVVSCCYNCNRAKNDRSVDEFLLWVTNLKIVNFQPLTIVSSTFPIGSLATSVRCVFYNHKKDTDMTVEEYYSISQMNCFYCGGAPNNIFNRAKTDKKASYRAKQEGNYIYNGIDRIDRSLPHNKNNVVPCCYWCNFAKSKLTLIEFQTWITRIQTFQHK